MRCRCPNFGRRFFFFFLICRFGWFEECFQHQSKKAENCGYSMILTCVNFLTAICGVSQTPPDSSYNLMDWICFSDFSGPALLPVPPGSGVSDQVLGHTRRNWQKDLDSGARKTLPVWHHEADCHRYRTQDVCDAHEIVIRGMGPVFVEIKLFICRKQRVHQSGGGSQTSGDASRVFPVGSRAWWVEPQKISRQISPDDNICSEVFLLVISLLQL